MKKTMHRLVFISLVFLLILVSACKKEGSWFNKVDYEDLPAISGELVNVVVEIPAGSNHKIEFDKASNKFLNDQVDGKDRVIDFLPYPGNYGFIPGTLMDKARGGDGDALDILVIGETQPTGSVLIVQPIAAMLLKDRGELDTKIIAIPAEPSERVMRADNFLDFMLEYDAARKILEDWFLNYKGPNQVQFIRWEDDKYAMKEIENWLVK